jgi:hypothetical protein
MTRTQSALAGVFLAWIGHSSTALALDVTPLNPADYQSFVGNWTPADAPLCAAIGSAEAWNRVLHPAAVMGDRRPFAPPSEFWERHAVLLFARVVPGGGQASALRLAGAERSPDAIDIVVAVTPPPPSSWTMKSWLAVAVPKPLPPHVGFLENGKRICSLEPASGHWLSPAQ